MASYDGAINHNFANTSVPPSTTKRKTANKWTEEVWFAYMMFRSCVTSFALICLCKLLTHIVHSIYHYIISLLQEDKRLTHLVNSSWKTSWSIISQQMPDRTAKQCRERYVNNLDPDRKKGAWTEEEDEIIMKLQAELGTQWSKISAGESPSFFPICFVY